MRCMMAEGKGQRSEVGWQMAEVRWQMLEERRNHLTSEIIHLTSKKCLIVFYLIRTIFATQ